MRYESRWREEPLADEPTIDVDKCRPALGQVSVAARAGRVNGTDQRDRHQKNEGGDEGENNHNSLLKIVKGKCKRSAKPHVLCFQLIAIEDV